MKAKNIILFAAFYILAAACTKEARTTKQVDLSPEEVQKIVKYNPNTMHYELNFSQLPKTKADALDIDELQSEIDNGNRLLDSILSVNKNDSELKKIEFFSNQSPSKTVFSKSSTGDWNKSVETVNGLVSLLHFL